jgi:NAD(P)-dependent dehydrogenase (short-subunit alcohol dehydrogenase family)
MKKFSLALFAIVLAALGTPASAGEGGTVLVTGANRGIGLEYARQFSAKGYTVIGTARRPDAAEELAAVAERVEQLDVADPASVAALAKRLDGVPIDILINNAGILDRNELTIDTVNYDSMERAYQVNTIGPLRVTQSLLPNVRAGDRKLIISMSSQLGSIERSKGRYYSYRASKAALNMLNSIWSAEFGPEGITCTVLHPGWVRTDLGGPNATYSPQESVAGLIRVIEGLTTEDNGRFYDFQGQPIAW